MKTIFLKGEKKTPNRLELNMKLVTKVQINMHRKWLTVFFKYNCESINTG